MKILPYLFLLLLVTPELQAQTPVQKNIPKERVKFEKEISPPKVDRQTVIIDSMIVSKGDVMLELWDNEREDGDTVSVWLNGRLILRDFPIVHEPKQVPLQLEKGKTYIVSFYSVSEGHYPPCTGTLKISSGEQIREIKIAANAQKNGAVKLIYPNEK